MSKIVQDFRESEDYQYDRLQGSRTISRCRDLMSKQLWSDCTFVVGPADNKKTFKSHKILLSVCSPVFETMFFGGLRETGNINIPDVLPDTFASLLSYAYTREVNLGSIEEAIHLYCAAHKYIILDLLDSCTNYICTNMDPQRTLQVLQCGWMYDDKKLMDAAISMVRRQCSEVLASPILEDVQLGVLEIVFDQDVLNVGSELELFDALVRWSTRDCERRKLEITKENQRMVLGGLLKKVRFLTLSPKEFSVGPAASKLLTVEETSSVLLNMASEGEIPLVDSISSCTFPRQTKLLLFKSLGTEDVRAVRPGGGPFLESIRNFQRIEEHYEVIERGRVRDVTVPSQEVNLQALECLYPEYDVSSYEEEMRFFVRRNGMYHDSWCYNNRVEWGRPITFELASPLYFDRGDIVSVEVQLTKFGWYPLSPFRFKHFSNNYIGKNFFFVMNFE